MKIFALYFILDLENTFDGKLRTIEQFYRSLSLPIRIDRLHCEICKFFGIV